MCMHTVCIYIYISVCYLCYMYHVSFSTVLGIRHLENMCAFLLTRSTLRPLLLLCAAPAVSPQVQTSKHQQAIAADAADTADTAGTAAGTYRRRKQCTLRGKKGMSRGTIWAWLGTNIISTCSSCCNRPTISNNLMTTWPQDATSPSASKHLDATARPVRSSRARCSRGRSSRGRASPLTQKSSEQA